MKRFLSVFLSLTLLFFLVAPSFSRSYGGGYSSGRSFSSGFSSRSSFTSTRSFSSSYSKGFSSRPSLSFTKSTPKTYSYTKPSTTFTRTAISTPKTVKVTKVVTVRRTSTPVVVHNYGNGVNDTLTTMLLLHALTTSNNNSVTVSKAQLNTIRNEMLHCYDQGGGRSCITRYL